MTTLIFLGLTFSGFLIGLFFIVFEEHESEKNIGLQGEAAFNPLLVAQRFLENTGIESESIVSMLKLKEMPAQKDILFLATKRFDIGPELRTKILDWVDAGGHLIIVAWPSPESDTGIHDPILEELNITVEQDYSEYNILACNGDDSKDSDSVAEKQEQQKWKNNPLVSKQNKNNDIELNEQADNKTDLESEFKSECKKKEFAPIDVTILTDREKSKIAFNPSIWLATTNEAKPNWIVSDENGSHLIEFIRQKGLITVLSDYRFLTNEHLNNFDHAAFLWYLVHYSNNSGKVWIIYNGDMPPLYEWLYENMWAPFLMLFLIIIIWIWSVLVRFGAIYPEVSSHRRNLIEHIRASGLFLWKHKFSEDLIHETRNALHEKITKRHPNWNSLSEKELYSRLSKQTAIDVEQVELAFTTQSTKKEQEFLLIIQTLERLRKSI